MTMFWGQCNICQQRWPLGSPSECTCPQESNWKGLTDDEIDRVTDQQWATNNNKPIYAAHKAYARAIEAKLKEKNM